MANLSDSLNVIVVYSKKGELNLQAPVVSWRHKLETRHSIDSQFGTQQFIKTEVLLEGAP